MTTNIISGTFVSVDSFGNIVSVDPTALVLTTRDDVTSFTYSILQTFGNAFGTLARIGVIADVLNLTFNGERYAPDEIMLDVIFAEVSWGLNNTSLVLLVEDESAPSNGYALFVLAGDPLPDLTTPDDVVAFDLSVTAVNVVTSGPFGPNTDIPFSSLQTFSSTEVDLITGTAQDETFVFSQAADHYDGKGGTDTVDFTGAGGRVLADLQVDVSGAGFAAFFSQGAGEGDTFANIENLTGGAFADNLRGDAADNVLNGGGVSDRLYGRAGNDTLNGGTGADALYGNTGVDVMTGGPDLRADRFIFFNMNETGVGAGNRDIITDFQTGLDRIEIRRFDADTTQGGRQSFNFIADAGFSNTAGELRFEQVGGNTIVQGDVNGDGLADFEIELTGTITLVEGDFFI